MLPPVPTVDAAALGSRLLARGDQRVLKVLGQQSFAADALASIVRAWDEQREADETLVDFLVRGEVLQPAAPPVLAMNWGDELLLVGTEDLFLPNGLTRLRQIAGAARGGPELTVPARVEPKKSFTVPTLGAVAVAEASPPESAPPVSTAELASGQLLGRCLITGRLAAGSYGIVYRALHRTLNIPVAVKVLHPDLLESDAKAAAQFRTEAMLLARLNHPNIVRVWDFDDTVIPPYIVLEFVEGANIAEMIARRGLIRVDLAVRVVLQVIDGLEAAYQHGIVHRDIKPANILLTREENAKIADLGLAVVADRGRQIGLHLPATTPSALAGTVAYLAPEQAGSSGIIDHRSDIYSLGATFYHMVTGQLPFNGRSPLEVLMKHARLPVVPPHEIVPGMDAGVSAVIVRMLAKSPTDRYRTYDELRDALIDADIALHSTASGLTDELLIPKHLRTGGRPPLDNPPPPPPKPRGMFDWLRKKR